MHALHSFWTKPALSHLPNERKTGGWATETQHWCSWILSCMAVGKHYPVHLVTDRRGKEILVDALQLPYAEVTVALDDLQDIDADFWAFGKIYAYSLQTKPFFSLDADVFLWEALPAYLTEAPLFCQENEYFDGVLGNFSNYLNILKYTQNFQKPAYADTLQFAVNAGIFGGNNPSFFAQLWADCKAFLQQNEGLLAQQNFSKSLLNLYCEQYLAACLAHSRQERFMPLRYDYETWEQLYGRYRYTHLMAGSKLKFGRQVEERVKRDFPAYYARLIDVL